jgi:hypothetical protein
MTPSRSLSPRRYFYLAGWELKTRLRFPSSHSKSWGWIGRSSSRATSPAHLRAKGALLALESRKISRTDETAPREPLWDIGKCCAVLTSFYSVLTEQTSATLLFAAPAIATFAWSAQCPR